MDFFQVDEIDSKFAGLCGTWQKGRSWPSKRHAALGRTGQRVCLDISITASPPSSRFLYISADLEDFTHWVVIHANIYNASLCRNPSHCPAYTFREASHESLSTMA